MQMCRVAAGLTGALLLIAPAHADSIELVPVRDNTVFAESGLLSNGIGMHSFAGNNGAGNPRRMLLAFDLTEIPKGSVIGAVSLQLYMSRTMVTDRMVAAHALLADWGEDESDAKGEEGAGAGALPGDTTWSHRFLDGAEWDTPGGDFVAEPSAVTNVIGKGFYVWTSETMMSDVRGWVEDRCSNAGWIIIGDETDGVSAKRFDTRENPIPAFRPLLSIEFMPPKGEPCPADIDESGDVGFTDLLQILAAWGPCGCCAQDLDMSGDVGFTDLLQVLAAWGPCP